jgi:magnesium transporter
MNTLDKMDVTASEKVWIRLLADDHKAIAAEREKWSVNFPSSDKSIAEDDLYYYLPVTLTLRLGDEFHAETVVFALGDGPLITLQSTPDLPPLDRFEQRLTGNPAIARNGKDAMRLILRAMNLASDQVIEAVSVSLETMNDEIQKLTSGRDEKGREIGVSDVNDTMLRLNEMEELIARVQESQLDLARCARYLRSEIGSRDTELRTEVEMLQADITGVKEHATFEHEKVRYLQQSVMTSLGVKQNQIVKVFTIITAVFLPPTLVATFYGMNFAVMPELSWEWGFTVTIAMTLAAALLPLIYIRQKGWLR